MKAHEEFLEWPVLSRTALKTSNQHMKYNDTTRLKSAAG